MILSVSRLILQGYSSSKTSQNKKTEKVINLSANIFKNRSVLVCKRIKNDIEESQYLYLMDGKIEYFDENGQ